MARCPELDFVAQGRDREEARRNLLEVVEIQLEEMAAQGTLDDYLAECGFTQESDGVAPGIELISVEKQSLQVA